MTIKKIFAFSLDEAKVQNFSINKKILEKTD